MEAISFSDFGEWSVEEFPNPDPAGDEVLVDVERVQLSVTDCQLSKGMDVVHYENVRERLDAGDGRLFGHEFCGTVADVGPDVEAFEPGDRVYAAGKVPCTECAYCEAGYEHLCVDKETIGLERPGALAEYVLLPTHPLCKLPDGVSDAEGAAMQPLASAVLCVRDADIDDGDTVCVVGTGVMGYQCGQLALQQGAGTVYALDMVPEKLDAARERGLRPIDIAGMDAAVEVREENDGFGADVVFECVGGNQTNGTQGDDPLALALELSRSGGTIVQVGSIAGDITIRPRSMRSKQVRWVNPTRGVVSLGPNSNSGALAAHLVAADRVSIDEYITHELHGLESFDDAVEMTMNKEDYGALGPPQIVL